MTKRVNKDGQDDVLSSVRRLVRAKPTVDQPHSAQVLMLSPRYRVTKTAAQTDGVGRLELRDPLADSSDLDQKVAKLREIVARNSPQETPDGVLVLRNPIVSPDQEPIEVIVARLVRAELQGEMGERITRNVRKLVRREIHRAFAADELD